MKGGQWSNPHSQNAPSTEQAAEQVSAEEEGAKTGEAPPPQQFGPQENDEGAIVFEQVDFERLQEAPKY
jgi:hypothetical protein